MGLWGVIWAKAKGKDWAGVKVAHLDVPKANRNAYFISRSLFSFQRGPELKHLV